MWLFLGSECLLFGGLISTYMLYRGRHEGGPGPDQIFDIPLTSVSSFILLMSSLTMVFAVSAAAQKDDRRTNLWLTVSLQEGKNREVKRICEHLGLQVNRLIRTSFGPFVLGELPRGGIEEVPTRAMKSSIGEKFFKKEDDAHRRWKVQRP